MKLPDIAHRLQKQLLGPKEGELISFFVNIGAASSDGTILWYWPGTFPQYVVHSFTVFDTTESLNAYEGSYFLFGSYKNEGDALDHATHEFDRRVVGG